MKNLPPQVLEQIRESIKRPVGTVAFTYTFNDDLFDVKIAGGKLFEVISGKQYFLVERTDNFEVKFYHSSPGTGTREATIDLNKLIPSKKVFFCFVWSPKEIRLSIGPKYVVGVTLVTADGIKSAREYKVGENGDIYAIGGEGMKIMGVKIRENGKVVLESTAIESWEETRELIRILHTGQSSEGYIFDTLISNLTFPLMVTGFEVYAKRRFSELESEGIKPNFEKVVEKMRPSRQYKTSQEMIGTINFQDFKNECKNVYSYAYDIRFREIGIRNKDLLELETIFDYRGRLTHNSSLFSMLNESLVPQQKPVFNNKTQATEYVEILNNFILNLHEATLKLQRKDVSMKGKVGI